MIGKLRSDPSSYRLPAAWPPIAAWIVVLMSPGASPYRAAFARSTSMRTVGWPNEENTPRSAMPGTVAITSLILFAVFSSVSRSPPNSFTEFSPFTPEAASSTLSSMYWEKLKSTPGKSSCNLLVISSVSLSLSTPAGHVSNGFSGTKNSALKKPVASVPSSGRPCCDTTVTTSGKDFRMARMRLT